MQPLHADLHREGRLVCYPHRWALLDCCAPLYNLLNPSMQLHPALIGSSEDAYHHGRPISIVPDARRRHLAVFGGSGSGKSTLFRNMLAADIAAGHGVTVVHPHGQLVEEIIENHIPRHRTNDVIYFNPKDQERAFALNMLDCRRPDQRVSSSRMSSAFSKNSGRTPGDRAWRISSETVSMR